MFNLIHKNECLKLLMSRLTLSVIKVSSLSAYHAILEVVMNTLSVKK